MIMPNFLIIGAAKAGTTSLYVYLQNHPQIFMSSQKEPNFFAFEGETLDFCGPYFLAKRPKWVTDLQTYHRLFSEVMNEPAIGEASILYLYHPKAPERIQHYMPDGKLIAILRNPVDRAYSSYCYMCENALEPLADFSEALQVEEARITGKWEHIWHYKQMGFYHKQLKRYFDRFDRSQMKIYLYEDFAQDNLRVIREIYEFLGVDPAFRPDTSIRYNESGIPKNKKLQALYNHSPARLFLRNHLPKWLVPVLLRLKKQTLTKPQLSSEVRQGLVEEYREDILCLQDLLQRDLSMWLKP
jgi:hypothetical protein